VVLLRQVYHKLCEKKRLNSDRITRN